MFAYPLHPVSDNAVKRSHKLYKTCSTLSKFVLFLNSFEITLLAARHFKQIFVWKRKVHTLIIHSYYWMMILVLLQSLNTILTRYTRSFRSLSYNVNINVEPQKFQNKTWLTSMAEGTSSNSMLYSVELIISNNLRNGLEICFELKYCTYSW